MRRNAIAINRITLNIAMLAGMLLHSVAASANELYFAAIVEGAEYRAEEYRYGALFNREDGELLGPYLHGKYVTESWQFSLEHRNLSGTIDYRGQTQIGIPIISKTDSTYSQFGATAAYQLRDSPFYLGIALRSRIVDRRIRATPISQALHETLRQTEWGPVAGAEWKPSEKLTLAARLTTLTTIRSSLNVDFPGTYDSGKLNLPRNSGRDLQFALNYEIHPSYALAIEVCGQHFTPARSSSAPLTSNGVPVGLYNYPGSTQDLWTIGAGLLIHW